MWEFEGLTFLYDGQYSGQVVNLCDAICICGLGEYLSSYAVFMLISLKGRGRATANRCSFEEEEEGEIERDSKCQPHNEPCRIHI